MSFSLLHKLVAYLFAGLGLLALTLGGELSLVVKIAIAVGFIASYFAEGELLLRPRYALSWTLGVLLFLVLQIARALFAGPSLAMALEFAAFLQISRLFNRRSAVEYQQVAVLSFLHLIAATILTTSLIYAAVFLGFVISTPWMLALTNLRLQVESNYSGLQGPNEKAVIGIRRVLASKRVVGPSFLWGTAALAVPLFLITLAIFVAVPRVGKGFFPFQRARGQRVTGFGSFVELGGFGVIRDDPTVVLRIKESPATKPHTAGQLFRMRGTSFDHYDGKRWTRSPSQRIPFPRNNGYYPIRRWPDSKRDKRLRIVLDHLDQRVLFLPDDTVALEFSLGMLKGLSKAPQLFRSDGLDVRYVDEGELGLIYNAYTNKDAWRFESKSLDTQQRKRYLQIPENHDLVVELSQRIAQPAETTAAKIMRIHAYLRDSGTFRYSLELPDVGDKPPLVAFLFHAKKGHCEYFSTAMAMMLRGIGVPSRNVTGFVGGRYNPFGGYWALRQGDAHSWVEAFIRGTGWITLDPTPPAMTAIGPTDGLWSDIYALFDAIRTRWETSVIAYDLQTQVVMLRGVVKWMARFRSDVSNTSARSDDTVRSKASNATYIVLAIISILVLSVLVWAIVHKRRTALRAGTTSLSKDASEAVALYRDLEQVLTRLGHARAPSATPLEHSERLRQQGFIKADAVETITRRYMEVRFGNRPLTPSEVKSLRAVVSEIRTDTG